MPQLSVFYGISIMMFYNDHNPPHFHAYYGEFKALIAINGFGIIGWKLPPKAHALIIERASLHHEELLLNREQVKTNGEFIKIKPLE